VNKLFVGGGLLAALGLGFLLTKDAKGQAPPSPSPTPEGPSLPLLGDPLAFKKGAHYRGRLTLKPGDLPPFNAEASTLDIARGLKALGFQDIGVYEKAEELPTNWPKHTADAPLPGTRWFEGTWGLESASVPRPWQIEAVWTADPNDNPRLGRNREADKLTLA